MTPLTLNMAVSGEDSADIEHGGVCGGLCWHWTWWFMERAPLTLNMVMSMEDSADIEHGGVHG